MIRKTVAKAFARKAKRRPKAPVHREIEEQPLRGIHAVFRELHETFVRAVERFQIAGRGDPSLRISGVRQELEGQEFTVEARGRALRFRNVMNGLIWVLEGKEENRPQAVGVLCLHPDELGVSRLVEKSLEARRTAFAFTSIPRVVEDILGKLPRRGAEARSSQTTGEEGRA